MISAISGVHFWSLPTKGGRIQYSNEEANGVWLRRSVISAAAAIQVASNINGEACMFAGP